MIFQMSNIFRYLQIWVINRRSGMQNQPYHSMSFILRNSLRQKILCIIVLCLWALASYNKSRSEFSLFAKRVSNGNRYGWVDDIFFPLWKTLVSRLYQSSRCLSANILIIFDRSSNCQEAIKLSTFIVQS